MSKRLVLSPCKGGLWELEYKYTRKYKDMIIEVPKGFKTDLASIPRFLWSFLPPFGNYTTAAVVHDKLCVYDVYDGYMKRSVADDIFLNMMLEDGVKPKLAYLMYFAIRIASIYKTLTKLEEANK